MLAKRVITSEINHNLAMMADYVRQIDLDNPVRIAGNHSGWEWTAIHPPPVWSRVTFEGTFKSLSDALTEEKFLATFGYFARLELYTQAARVAADCNARRAPHDEMSAAFFVADQIAKDILTKGSSLDPTINAQNA